ncbi:MAG TPA: DUF6766 family protein [Planctomycetota bacterium]|nr:DUF6766 family protein [Planctomycetota bacterium]
MGMRRFLRDNGLTIVLLAVTALTLVGHALTGWRTHVADQEDHGEAPITLAAYLIDPAFLESVAENWESEFLQMAAFVALTIFLFQKGSPESKDPDEHDEVDDHPRTHPIPADAPRVVHTGGWRLKLYENSLTIALLALFAISFGLHAWSSQRHANDERADHGDPPVALIEHLGSARFWFESFQNWQSEFLSIAVLVVFTIYLRQRGSSQSKPVAAPHHENE